MPQSGPGRIIMGRAIPTLRPIEELIDEELADIPLPHSDDDRAYLILMYEEHARQAGQQETFKTIWTTATLVVLAALLVAAVEPARQFVCGILLCVTAVLGILVLGKHQERYELHLRVMRGFRGAFAKAVRREIPGISAASRVQHNRRFRPFRFVNVRLVWTMIYIAAFAVGALIASRGEAPQLSWPETDQTPMDAKVKEPAPLSLPGTPLIPGDKPH